MRQGSFPDAPEGLAEILPGTHVCSPAGPIVPTQRPEQNWCWLTGTGGSRGTGPRDNHDALPALLHPPVSLCKWSGAS
jgi:hypothetical protein